MPLFRMPSADSKNYKWWSFLAIAIGLFVSVADVGSVVVALPTIADHFHTDLPTTQWVIVGYALTISALLLPMGRLSDIVGRKKVYIIGYVLFPIGAFLAGFSFNVLLLILARVFMGIGGAMTQGTAMAMHISAFPEKERGKAIGLILSVVGMGGVLGPAVGGVIVGTLGWRAVFIVTGALSVLALLVAQVILDGRLGREEGKRPPFDWLGAGLSAMALVAFLLILSMGPKVGWRYPGVIAGFLLVVISLTVFVWWENRTPTPMLYLGLFKRRVFSFGLSASFIGFFGMSSVRFLMPFYLQSGLGYSPGQMGLILVPGALGLAIAGTISGRLSDRFGWRKFNMGGLAISAAGLLILSRLTLESPLALVMIAMGMQSIGLGTFNPPNTSSILSAVGESRYGVVSGFLNLVRNSANVTGIAVATAIVTAVMASMGFLPSLAAVSEAEGGGVLLAFTSGMRVAFMIAAALVILGIVFSFAKGRRNSEMEIKNIEESELPIKPL